jgi:crotonobetainyl-CoA:carnitine CoA-transferase CaiB-like acyl-CoA transferase
MDLPLKGTKVIDFTGVQAGPAGTQMMAWFGADVLKVERPGSGDVTRHRWSAAHMVVHTAKVLVSRDGTTFLHPAATARGAAGIGIGRGATGVGG